MSSSNIKRTYYISAAFKVLFAEDKSQESLRKVFAAPGEKLYTDSHLHQRTETKSVFFSESRAESSILTRRGR
jgi:hypothetical protein